MRGLCQFPSHLTKCHACHGTCTLSPLDAALTIRFAKNTQHDTSKVLRLPRNMNMDTSKVLHMPRKMEGIFWKRCKSLAPVTHMTLDTLWDMFECHEVPRLPRKTRLRDVWNLQKWPLLQNSPYRHGHPHANGCEGLRAQTQHRANTPSTPRPPEWNGNSSYAFGKHRASLWGGGSSKGQGCFEHLWVAMIFLLFFIPELRSEGFPFIVGGLGVGPLFAASWSARRFRVVFASFFASFFASLIRCL